MRVYISKQYCANSGKSWWLVICVRLWWWWYVPWACFCRQIWLIRCKRERSRILTWFVGEISVLKFVEYRLVALIDYICGLVCTVIKDGNKKEKTVVLCDRCYKNQLIAASNDTIIGNWILFQMLYGFYSLFVVIWTFKLIIKSIF